MFAVQVGESLDQNWVVFYRVRVEIFDCFATQTCAIEIGSGMDWISGKHTH